MYRLLKCVSSWIYFLTDTPLRSICIKNPLVELYHSLLNGFFTNQSNNYIFIEISLLQYH